MAKIKFGMMMTDARGKLGGQVFSKNRSGAYVRTKVTPVNPRTSYQQDNRALLGTLSTGWSKLTQEARNAWNGAVESWLKTNVFGDLQKPTGKNLFTGLNKNMFTAFPARPLMTMPPAKVEFAPFSVSSQSLTASGVFTVQLGGDSVGGQNFSVRATPPLSPAVTYVQNLLRTLGVAIVASETGVLTLTVPYQERFGGVSANFVVWLELRQVATNGQLGVPFMVRVPVTA